MGVETPAYPRRRPASRAAGALLHSPRAVYDFIYRQVGNRQDAEDLTRKVVERVGISPTERLGGSAIADKFSAATREVLSDHWGRHYAGSPALSLDSTQCDIQLEVRLPAPRGNVGRGEIDVLIHTLPLPERRILVLRFLDGLSIRETARELEMGEAEVRVLQRGALMLLASAIESRWWDESGEDELSRRTSMLREPVEVAR